MSIKYNAEEVLNMAVKLEKNGAAFYRKAASQREATDPEAAALFKALAEMEDGHVVTFSAMLDTVAQELAAEPTFDPYLEANLYLHAVADAYGGEGAPDVTDALTGDESVGTILTTAIDMEGKAILFYLGIKDMVPESLGKDKLDDIIDEEKKHLVSLTEELKKLQA